MPSMDREYWKSIEYILFGGVSIEIIDDIGNVIKVSDWDAYFNYKQKYDYQIQICWKVDGLLDNVRYDVILSNIIIDDVPVTYTY